jgi:hypothetical protein
MKKLFFVTATLFSLLFATSAFAAKQNGTPIGNVNNLLTKVGDYYYILFNDGCYHLGVVVEDPDGSIWWEPLGYWNWATSTTICMEEEDFAALC